ncbi:MAG: flagellar basal-body rod protein FlgG [Planctomycetota bacterium]
MAITALHSAATGLKALSTQIDVVANNLANAETGAFKRSRVNFEDLLYVEKRAPGALNRDGDVTPSGVYVGVGVTISNTALDLTQGPLEPTDRELDVAIEGDGFFRVAISDDIGDGTAYTRNGNFFRAADGALVLGVGDGYRLEPQVNIPDDIVPNSINISQDGEITVLLAGEISPTNIGEIEIFRFVNPQGLRLLGGSLYQETEASGDAIQTLPGENGAGELVQAHLESSNVDPVKELVTLIKTQRAFELNSQSIQTADQALQTIGNLRRY